MADAFNLTAQLNLRGPSNIKTVVADIRRQIGSVNATLNFKVDPAANRNISQLNSTLRTFNSTLAQTQTSANNTARALSNLGRSVNGMNIRNLPQQVASSASALNKMSNAASSTTKTVTVASTAVEELGKQSYLAVKRFAAFSIPTAAVFALTNAINKGVSAFIEYDKQFVKLQQITGESANGLQNLSKTITSLATGLGVASTDITDVASTLAQAGLSARDTERALKALALSSLAPSFDSMNETVEGSIALMRQFDISAGDLEKALGSVNSVAAKFAVEASDIIVAIQRTGGVFATASKGVSEGTDALNEFIAVFTSVRATTRESAETIATGLRTIFTRIQRGKTIEALKEYGVNLTDLDGKFVGAYKAVELLSKGLNQLDPRDLKFSQIVEELGGFRQIGKVIPLIQQFATAQEALKVAQKGQGSLAADAAKAQESLANKITKVKEEFFALFREIGSSQGFQTIIRGALDLSSALIKVADSIKGILPALTIFAAFKGVSALTQFTTGFAGAARARKAEGGPVYKFQRGGVVPGSGRGDKVPALLEPGEVVINNAAANIYGRNNLNKINKRMVGGLISKFKIGGKSLGARSKFKELSQEEIYKLSTPELIAYGKALARDIFTTGGAGMAVASEFIEVPKERITPELEPYLKTYAGKKGFWSEKVSPFGRPSKKLAKIDNTKNRQRALAAQTDRYADEVAARDQRWINIRSGSSIDNYLLKSLQDPILSDYRTVRGGGTLSKAFHNTRLRQAVNQALEKYDDFDYSAKNVDKLVSGMAVKRFAYGGKVQRFEKGGLSRTDTPIENAIRQNMINNNGVYEFGLAALRSGTSQTQQKQEIKINRKDQNNQKQKIKGILYSGSLSNNTVKGLDTDIEKQMMLGITNIVSNSANKLNELVKSRVAPQPKLNKIIKSNSFQALTGNMFESALGAIGSPYIDKAEATKSIDFPLGLGPAASLFGIKSNIPTDATRTLAGSGKGKSKIIEQIKRFLTAIDNNSYSQSMKNRIEKRIVSRKKQDLSQNDLLASILDKLPRGGDVISGAQELRQKYNLKKSALTRRGLPTALSSLSKTDQAALLSELTSKLSTSYAEGGSVGLDDIKKKILEKYPQINFRISKRKSGFGYMVQAGLSADNRSQVNFASNLKDLLNVSDKMAQDILYNYGPNIDQKLLKQLQKKKFASGGIVPAMVSNGEAYVSPETAQSIGYSKLHQMNRADSNGMRGFASGGISVFKGPGSGTSDSIGPVGLPEGSFILREKATKALGLASGGRVRGFARGGKSKQQDIFERNVTRSADISIKQGNPLQGLNKFFGSIERMSQSLPASSGLINNLKKTFTNLNTSTGTTLQQLRKVIEAKIREAEASGQSTAKIQKMKNALDTLNAVQDATVNKLNAQRAAMKQNILPNIGEKLDNTLGRIPGAGAVKGVSRLVSGIGRGLGGNAGFYGSMALGMLGGQGENLFGSRENNVNSARNVAKFEAGTSTLAAGLATASSIAMIPGVGPFAAALVAGVSIVKAWTSAVEAGKKAAEEFANQQRETKIIDLQDKLDKAFKDYQTNPNSANVLNTANIAAEQADLNRADTSAEVNRKQREVFDNRWWYSLRPQMKSEDINTIVKDNVNKAEPAANISRQLLEAKVASGTKIADLKSLPEFNKLAESIAAADTEYQKAIANTALQNILAEQNNKTLTDAEKKNLAAAEATAKRAAIDKVLNGEQLKAIQKSKEIADAFEAVNRAGRKLAMSFDRMVNDFNQALNRTIYELDSFDKISAGDISAIGGNARVVSVGSRDANILQNPNAYTAAERDAAQTRTANMFGKDSEAVKGMLKIDATDFSASITRSLDDALKNNAGLNLDEAFATAEKTLKEQLKDAPESVRTQLLNELEVTRKQIEDDTKLNNNKDKVDAFNRAVTDKLGQSSLDAAKNLKDFAVRLLEFRNGALESYIRSTNDAAEANRRAEQYRLQADNTAIQGRDALTETLGYGTPNAAELQARQNAQVAQLTGGVTDPKTITQNIQKDFIARKDAQDRLAKENDPAKQKALVQEIDKFNNKINKGQQALDKLANSGEVAAAALNDIKKMQQAMEGQGSFLDKLATSTPEEADRLSKAFMRLQNNLNGNFNGPSMEANQAYFEAIQQGADPITAQRAGYSVMAQQRGETLSLFNELKPLLEAQMRNQGMSDSQIADRNNQMFANLRTGIYGEAGLLNNPMLANIARGQIDYTRDPRNNPVIAGGMQTYEQAINNQAAAQFEQGSLASWEASRTMKDAATRFAMAVDKFNANSELARNNDPSRPNQQPLVPQPRQQARGGLIRLASGGNVVSAMVSKDEGYVSPEMVQKLGINTLHRLNKADTDPGALKKAGGGKIGVFDGPGTGTSDSIGPIGLPKGSYVIRASAMKTLAGYNKGGIVSLAEGGEVKPLDDITKYRNPLMENQRRLDARKRAQSTEAETSTQANAQPTNMSTTGEKTKPLISDTATIPPSSGDNWLKDVTETAAATLQRLETERATRATAYAKTSEGTADQIRYKQLQGELNELSQQIKSSEIPLQNPRDSAAQLSPPTMPPSPIPQRAPMAATMPNKPLTLAEAREVRRQAFTVRQAQQKQRNEAFKTDRAARAARVAGRGLDSSQETTDAQKWYDDQNFDPDNVPKINGRTATPLQAYRMSQRQKEKEQLKEDALKASLARGPLTYQTTAADQTGQDPATGRTWRNSRVRLGAGIVGANNDRWAEINDPTEKQRADKATKMAGYQANADETERLDKVNRGKALEAEIASGVSEDSLSMSERHALQEYRMDKMFAEGQAKDARRATEAAANKAKSDKEMSDRLAKAERDAEASRLAATQARETANKSRIEKEKRDAERDARIQAGIDADKKARTEINPLTKKPYLDAAEKAGVEAKARFDEKFKSGQLAAEEDARRTTKAQELANQQGQPKWKREDRKPVYTTTETGANSPNWVFPDGWDENQKQAFLAERRSPKTPEVRAKTEAQAQSVTTPQTQQKSDTWVGSKNWLVKGLGYVGGLGQATGEMAYGAANVVAGTAISAGGRIYQGGAYLAGSEAQQAAGQAFAQVGEKAIAQGAYTAVEAAQAVAGQGPIMTGDKTWLHQGDDERVKQAGSLGGITRLAQNTGYVASQLAPAVAGFTNPSAGAGILEKSARAFSSLDNLATSPGTVTRFAGKALGSVDNVINGGRVSSVVSPLSNALSSGLKFARNKIANTEVGAFTDIVGMTFTKKGRAALRNSEDAAEATSFRGWANKAREPERVAQQSYNNAIKTLDNMRRPGGVNYRSPIDSTGDLSDELYVGQPVVFSANEIAAANSAHESIDAINIARQKAQAAKQAQEIAESQKNVVAIQPKNQSSSSATLPGQNIQRSADNTNAQQVTQISPANIESAPSAAARQTAQKTVDEVSARQATQRNAAGAAVSREVVSSPVSAQTLNKQLLKLTNELDTEYAKYSGYTGDMGVRIGRYKSSRVSSGEEIIQRYKENSSVGRLSPEEEEFFRNMTPEQARLWDLRENAGYNSRYSTEGGMLNGRRTGRMSNVDSKTMEELETAVVTSNGFWKDKHPSLARIDKLRAQKEAIESTIKNNAKEVSESSLTQISIDTAARQAAQQPLSLSSEQLSSWSKALEDNISPVGKGTTGTYWTGPRGGKTGAGPSNVTGFKTALRASGTTFEDFVANSKKIQEWLATNAPSQFKTHGDMFRVYGSTGSRSEMSTLAARMEKELAGIYDPTFAYSGDVASNPLSSQFAPGISGRFDISSGSAQTASDILGITPLNKETISRIGNTRSGNMFLDQRKAIQDAIKVNNTEVISGATYTGGSQVIWARKMAMEEKLAKLKPSSSEYNNLLKDIKLEEDRVKDALGKVVPEFKAAGGLVSSSQKETINDILGSRNPSFAYAHTMKLGLSSSDAARQAMIKNGKPVDAKLNKQQLLRLVENSELMKKQKRKLYKNKKSGGGLIYADNEALLAAQKQGPDNQPVMATPGEFMVKKPMAQKHLQTLQAINAGYYKGGMVQYLNNGGVVGPKYYNAGGGVSGVPVAGRSGNGVNNTAASSAPEWLAQLDEKVNKLSSSLQESLSTMYSNLDNVANKLTTVSQEMPREMSITSNVNKNVNVNGIAGEWNKYQGDILKMAGEQNNQEVKNQLSGQQLALSKWSEGAIPPMA